MRSPTRRGALKTVLCLALTALIVAGTHSGPSHAGNQHKIHITDAWARVTLGKIANSAAYFSIDNSGTNDDRLIDARGDISDKIELHTHIRDGDIMRMRRLDTGVAVPAGKSVAFAPGGHHVMLIGVKSPLKEGNTFALTLVFEKAGTIVVDIPIKRSAPSGHSDHKHQHDHKH